jgi:arylsulfatase A-like enzyme/Flp pilus assembly protein TadD
MPGENNTEIRTMKKLKPILLVIALAILAQSCGSSDDAPLRKVSPDTLPQTDIVEKPYNVLLITLDTLRYDRLSIYTDKYVKTPNIDGLARKSFVFTRAFSHNPVTLPAHTNIMTGTTPRYHGISDNTGYRLDKRFLTLAEHLKENGYATGAFVGAFPLDSRFGLDQGFDVYDDNYGTHNAMEMFFVERRAEDVIEPALKWIKGRQEHQKWFAWVHLFDPHQPYMPPSPYREEYGTDLYSGEVAYMDACLEKLFKYLEKTGRLDNTVVVITGDHGEALGEKGEETHSYFAYNNTIRIPLVIHVPGTIHYFSGRKNRETLIGQNVCHTDIFPTISQLVGLSVPEHIQGKSLVPLLENRLHNGFDKDRKIYFESLTPYLNRGWAPLRGFVRGDVKYIQQPLVEVYNIKNDINEMTNIAETSNVKQMERDLVKLKLQLAGKNMMKRSQQISAEDRDKLKSLGYLSGSTPDTPKKFTEEHDLKRMLPLQNRMLAAIAMFQEGKYREPIRELKAVVEKSPAFVLVYRHIATIHKEFGNVQKAVEILEYGLSRNPGSVNLMSKLGIMLAEANRSDKAIELLEMCVKKAAYDPENFNFLGVAYYKKGDFVNAIKNYRKALELDNNYASVFNNIGTLYLRIFLKRQDRKAFREAEKNFNRALELDPRLFAAYNGRGAAYRYAGKPIKAIEDWKKTIEIKPDFYLAYINIGITYIAMKDSNSALKYLLLCKERVSHKMPKVEQKRLLRLIAEARK